MAFGDTIAQTVLGKPTVPEDTNNAPNTVAEGAAVNTVVGITAHSTFANGSADVDYSLSADSSGGGFKIDQSTGKLGEPNRYPVGNGANWVEIVDVQ